MSTAPKMREAWLRHRDRILRITTWLMAIDGGIWLGYQFWRLLFQTGYWGAIDIRLVQQQVHYFFSGVQLYRETSSVLYPPASYLIFLPFLGWIDSEAARWLWAAMMVVSLLGIASVVVDASGADTPAQKAFIALLPLAIYPTGAAIGNGQVIVFVLPLLLAGIFLALRARTLLDNLLAAFLILLALVKPSISAPFFWITLLIPKRLHTALFTAAGYIGLTLAATPFQQRDLWALLRDWMTGATNTTQTGGYLNVTAWLLALGFQELSLLCTLLLVLSLGMWIYKSRNQEIWILLGVTALVARFWVYHAWYDDLLILIPMIALYRIARRGDPNGRDIIAGILFALLISVMIAPGGLYLLPEPLNFIYRSTELILWLAALIFLITFPNYERQQI